MGVTLVCKSCIIGRFLRNPLRVIGIFTLVLGGAGLVLDAQQPRQVWARVADAAGAPIPGLSAEQFTVIEDGVRCRTLKAEPMDWPIRLTVLVDNGGKSSGYLLNLRNGVRGLLKEVPAGVETSLLTLAPQPRWIVRRRQTRSNSRRALA
jgi:hypothetical protein